MKKNAPDFFSERRDYFSEAEIKFRKLSNKIANLRWTSFLIFFVVFLYFFQAKRFSEVLLSLVVFLFIYFPVYFWHNRVKIRLLIASLKKRINEEELLRLSGKINGFHSGSQYFDTEHPYAKDLDIFGSNSLFQLINRCATISGTNILAQWLKYPASLEEITSRQEAVEELKNEVDFCQDIQAENRIYSYSEEELIAIERGEENPSSFFESAWILPLLVFLNLGVLTLFVCCALAILSWKLMLLPLLVNGLILNRTRPTIQRIQKHAERKSRALKTLSKSLKLIEVKTFKAKKLIGLRENLFQNKIPASGKIEKLSYYFEMLEWSGNPYFFLLINTFFLWDLHWVRRILSAQRNLEGLTGNWINSLAQFEALASLAGFYRLNEALVFPELTGEKRIFEAAKIAHPLIFSDSKISNDFSFNDQATTWILTGSNMSGKSTFLRTLGINAILAFAGAPVLVERLRISPFRVFSSMRTEDSLQESTSSFYAELRRLKQLLESISNDTPTFYLLDEILKGTNSADRHTGGKALVRQLLRKNTFGIVATHDLELGNLVNENSSKISNYNFSSEVKEGKLYFDYKLRKGICTSFNATILMKQMGIEIDD